MNKKKKIIISCLAVIAILICCLVTVSCKKDTAVPNPSRVVVNAPGDNNKDGIENIEDGNISETSEEEKNPESVKAEDETSEMPEGKADETQKEEPGKEEKEESKDVKENEGAGQNEEPQKETAVQVTPGSDENEQAPDKQATVYIRVEGYDGTLVPRRSVTAGIFDLGPYLGKASGSSAGPSSGWGVDKFKEPTAAHALVKLLQDSGYEPGKDYDLQDYGWSLYVAMIGGNREFDYRSTSGWMYRVNNVLPSVGCDGTPIKGGEEILWYFGVYGFDTLVTEMEMDSADVKAGDEVTVTLNGIKNDISTWKEYREPAKKAEIYVNGSPLIVDGNKVVTGDDGKAVIKFDTPGVYILSAERVNDKNLKDLVRPQPVTVNVK
ncbi:hypothetical protein OXPF_28040 [Oxobacter pfennigii]|uniref:Transcobalamin-like C-terminal domain-containing protein n=1 Tax=Oxobacter pfennigii TaxID=36849 RepID=A0A0P8WLN7_9CLOT|nr:DUF4430 domain-containing protein [Oxobacter pfennigii]KPU43363.1 hypothetical protein OXPF_28040 [Oxobacter pfennigii]